MPYALMLDRPRHIVFEEIKKRPLSKGEIRLRSLISGISHGTEMILYRGESAFHEKVFDSHLRVFTMPDGDVSAYPRGLGYEMVSEVIEVGAGVDGYKVGDLVHSGTFHAEETIIDVSEAESSGYGLIRIPDILDPEKTLFLSLGVVALQAIHDTGIKLGDNIAVFGLGTIGLIIVQMAKLNGAKEVIAVDPIALRRDAALRLGADMVIDPNEANGVGYRIKEHDASNKNLVSELPPEKRLVKVGVNVNQVTKGIGVDAAIDASGSYAALQSAISSVSVGGNVVCVGFYRSSGKDLRLMEEWHLNCPQLISSMGLWGCPHRDHPRWYRERMINTTMGLLCDGSLSTEGLITHKIPFKEAEKAYELLDTRSDETIKVALTY
jgi:2-desacetyl-2-hydroxyethyl bacteriochlorophyllide A dehydrogenase